MKNREKLVDMVIESFKPKEQDTETLGNDVTPDADTVDIDALENRIMERIEKRLKESPTEPETPPETPATETPNETPNE